MKHVKKAVLEIAQELPDECTWDEVLSGRDASHAPSPLAVCTAEIVLTH